MKRRLSTVCALLCALSLCGWGAPCRVFSHLRQRQLASCSLCRHLGAGADGLCHPGCCADERAHAERKGDCEAHRNGKRYAKAYGHAQAHRQTHGATADAEQNGLYHRYGEKYHRSGCQYLRKSKHAISPERGQIQGLYAVLQMQAVMGAGAAPCDAQPPCGAASELRYSSYRAVCILRTALPCIHTPVKKPPHAHGYTDTSCVHTGTLQSLCSRSIA